MKVILLSDVERLGQLGDEVVVARGYGRNYLIPQGFALLATSANSKLFEQERTKYQLKMDELRAKANNLKESVEGKSITITVRTGENNKLYGSITTHMIAEALEKEGITVDRRKILLDAPIRAVGEYTIRIRLHANIVSEFTLIVMSDRSEVYQDDIEEQVAEVEQGVVVEKEEVENNE